VTSLKEYDNLKLTMQDQHQHLKSSFRMKMSYSVQ